MAALGTILTVGSAVVGAGAAVYSAYETTQQGAAARDEAYRQAGVDIAHGKEEFAASQRQADERRAEGRLIMSRQLAYAAASGGGAGSDAPTITKILGDTGRRAEYGAESVMYAGAGAQGDYNATASARRRSGDNNFFGSLLTAAGTLAGGIGHLGESVARYIPVAPPVGATG